MNPNAYAVTCPKCLAADCAVLARFEDYGRDPFAIAPLQNAMLACGVAASYRTPQWTGEQPVTLGMIQEIAIEHERSRR